MKTVALLALALAAATLSPAAYASIETDRSVGRCIAYLMAVGKRSAADLALRQADDRERALQFVRAELAEATRMRQSGNWTEAVKLGWATRGDSACRSIGIRPGDHR